jgi:hypothetical protein
VDWKHIKIISAIVGVTLIASLSFVLGISFGVTFNQDSLINVVIPSLSALGSWVAGIGALAAVFTSLWLAEQQRKNSGESLKNAFDVFVFPPDLESRLAVNVTCTGNKPSNLNSITIHSKDSQVALAVVQLDIQGSQLPMALSYGQVAGFILPLNSETSIKDYVKNNCSGSYKNLVLNINTSTKSFSIPFNNEVIKHLQDSANK